MNGLALLCLAVAALPRVELETLDGAQAGGELVALSPERIVLAGSESDPVPLNRVLGVRVVRPASADLPPALPVLVSLTDGSRISASAANLNADTLLAEGTVAGKLSVPLAAVVNVRFSELTPKIEPIWAGLLQKESRKDLLVIRKGDTIDFVAGAVGDVGEKVRFLLDGEEVPVAREKVFGIIYARRTPPKAKTLCEARLAGGDQLQLTSLNLAGEAIEARLAAGNAAITFPVSRLESLDFSLGKLRYLSDLEPRQVKYTPQFDLIDEFRRNRASGGQPITLSGKAYSRGLWMHSRTQLTYRLGGDFRRFTALLGIDDQIDRGLGEAVVRIRGDDRVLYTGTVRARESAIPLDLDVSGVRDLEILVDFGPNDDGTGDHVVFAEARLLK